VLRFLHSEMGTRTPAIPYVCTILVTSCKILFDLYNIVLVKMLVGC